MGDNVLRSENNFTQLYYAVIENGEIGEPRTSVSPTLIFCRSSFAKRYSRLFVPLTISFINLSRILR